MKILILVPVYKRPNILKAHLRNIAEFISANPQHQFIPFYILSEEDVNFKQNRQSIRHYKFEHCYYRNFPVGEKLNAGLNLAMEVFEFDYLMNMGSDDLLNPYLMKIYEPYINAKHPFFGINNLYFYDIYSLETIFFRTMNNDRSIGAGRMVHISVIKDIRSKGDNFWLNNFNSGLDSCSGTQVRTYTSAEEKVIDVGDIPMVIDIKSYTNINLFKSFKDKDRSFPADFNILPGHIPFVSKVKTLKTE